MFKPDLKEFLKLSKKGNVIPVYMEVNADMDTPVSSFLKIKQGDYSFLLESVEGQEKIARYSFLGTNPSMIFKSRGRQITIIDTGRNKSRSFVTKETPLDEIKKIMRDLRSVELDGLPRFYGGFVGYIGYDTVRFFEKIPDKNKDLLEIPDTLFILTDTILIFDRLNHSLKIVSNVILPKEAGALKKKQLYQQAIKKIESMHDDFNRFVIQPKPAKRSGKLSISSNLSRQEFIKMVKKGKEYIKKGDIIQVVLSQRFKVKTQKDHFEVYRALRSLNPSPYMYYLKLKDFSIVGSSPEMLVRCEDGLVQNRPIAGTRRRGKNKQEDMRLEKELIADEKERAEHLMLVDLGRNDLGRISKLGMVKVDDFMRVEKYSHVMHLVSGVSAALDKKRFDIYDVLKAAFPAGTVSGSPKIRAMEIIDELENLRRS
ncbi:MAG: chorismate-binding protein, partial [Candidatus Omnitrophota bacterium]